MSNPDVNTATEALAPLLPQGTEIQGMLDDKAVKRLERSLQELADLGFEVGVRANELEVRHRVRGFKTVIQLSRPGDLGELRSLFLSLRRHFGRLRERCLPALFLPGNAVTAPYEHLRQVIDTCQKVRQAH